MNKILFVCCILTVFTGCIKIENAPTCPNAPHAPSITTAGPINVALGSSFTNHIANPDSTLTYKWIDPSGYSYANKNLINTPSTSSSYGQWGVIAQSSNTCASDTTKFTVNLVVTPCVGTDSFIINGIGTFHLSNLGSGTQQPYAPYKMSYFDEVNGSAYELDVYLPTKPTSSNIYQVSSDMNAVVYDGKCYITFSSSFSNYYSSQGYVAVVVTNGQSKINFCPISMLSDYSYNSFTASGNLIGN